MMFGFKDTEYPEEYQNYDWKESDNVPTEGIGYIQVFTATDFGKPIVVGIRFKDLNKKTMFETRNSFFENVQMQTIELGKGDKIVGIAGDVSHDVQGRSQW